ncbi:MAG: hypothetical protein P1U63_09835 [Coxiellaceae bacterium]|nr:hypothetical protein [Coxiellaceae bacterium]
MAKGWLIAWCCAAGVFFTGSIYANSYYVCYQSRNVIDSIKYFGCAMQNHRCDNNQLYHFGKYQNIIEQQHAYKRCMNSLPAPTHNHGLFVCYRDREHSADLKQVKYHQCQYSNKPCWKRELQRFGKYDTTRASELAFVRCRAGTPLFVK